MSAAEGSPCAVQSALNLNPLQLEAPALAPTRSALEEGFSILTNRSTRGGASRPIRTTGVLPTVSRSFAYLRPIFLSPAAPSCRGRLEHDPEKWAPVFGKDHAPPIS